MSQPDQPPWEPGQTAPATGAGTGKASRGRILYVLYANPAAYPPLEHGSRILADAGWQVFLLGAASRGTGTLRLPPHPGIKSRLWGYEPPGFKQKLHYFAFAVAAIFTAFRMQAEWVYVSDPLACPVGWLLSLLGWRVVYHEHDGPNPGDHHRTRFMRFISSTRLKLARRAAFCVLPNERRVQRFKEDTGTGRPVVCVMNCPRREEAEVEAGSKDAQSQFVVFYHGTIVPARLPVNLVQAISRLPDRVVLRIAGYETLGHPGYVDALKGEAARLEMGRRIEYLGPVPERADLLAECRRAQVGISLMPQESADLNEQTMAGASNKAFDYLACGVPMLVSELPQWVDMFVAPGFGLACDPNDPDSIEHALRWFVEHADEARRMGERGREQIRREWNYENQFDPVLTQLGSC